MCIAASLVRADDVGGLANDFQLVEFKVSDGSQASTATTVT